MSVKISRKVVKTARLAVSVLQSEAKNSVPVIMVHGNVSSSEFFKGFMAELGEDYEILAPDLRGFGKTEPLPINAENGLGDWAEDLRSLVDSVGLRRPFHLVGWSMGGGIVMQYAIDHSDDLKSLVLINPVSPFGFGGSKNIEGEPCMPNFAGSGGGTANPQFVKFLKEKERGESDPNSPRNVLNQFYFKPPFRLPKDVEENLLNAMLETNTDAGFYPGSFQTCEEWPGIKPSGDGINNAISPRYLNLRSITDIPNKVPILWIRGADDMIVSDTSFFDFGFLGQQGYVEGWPGEKIYPPQPMVSQTRHVLDLYKKQGGRYEEFVVADAGHSVFIEKQDVVLEKLRTFYSMLE